jgi:hypothetical protein
MVSSIDGLQAGAIVWAAAANTVPLMTIESRVPAMDFMFRFSPSNCLWVTPQS